MYCVHTRNNEARPAAFRSLGSQVCLTSIKQRLLQCVEQELPSNYPCLEIQPAIPGPEVRGVHGYFSPAGHVSSDEKGILPK